MSGLMVTLYARPDCHLCEDARALLVQAGRGMDLRLHEVNVDEDGALRARYGERVPVAVAGGRELVWPFTLQQARNAIQAALV